MSPSVSSHRRFWLVVLLHEKGLLNVLGISKSRIRTVLYQVINKVVRLNLPESRHERANPPPSYDRVNLFSWSVPLLSDMFSISPHPHMLEHASMKPSPLTPRVPNACPRLSPQMIPFTKPTEKATCPKQRPVPHPMLQRRNDQQDQRRRVFLTKVKQNGDERRWDSRAEQVVAHSPRIRQGMANGSWEDPKERFSFAPETMGGRASSLCASSSGISRG